MPSPLGHGLGGALVGLALMGGPAPTPASLAAPARPDGRVVGRTTFVAICVAAACLPDIDFLWGRHNMETHSLGAALIAALVVLAATRWRGVRLALAVGAAWASHVLFDWLGSDTTAPLGPMALWPWSTSYYFAHAYLFEAISRRYWLDNFWRHNLVAVISEAALLGPPTLLAVWLRLRQQLGRKAESGGGRKSEGRKSEGRNQKSEGTSDVRR